MKTGYGAAAGTGAIILLIGAVLAGVVGNGAQTGSDLLNNNVFLLCLALATLGLLVIFTAGIGFLIDRARDDSPAADADTSEPATSDNGSTSGEPTGIIGVSGDPVTT